MLVACSKAGESLLKFTCQSIATTGRPNLRKQALMVWNPKSPPAAAAIFLTGCAVIVYTVNDIQRTLKSNEQPMTPDQLQALKHMVDHHSRKSAGVPHSLLGPAAPGMLPSRACLAPHDVITAHGRESLLRSSLRSSDFIVVFHRPCRKTYGEA